MEIKAMFNLAQYLLPFDFTKTEKEMLEQLINLVKENAQEAIVNNQAVPNQFNDAAIGEAGNVIKDVLGAAVQNGNLQDVMGIFGNSYNLQNNPLVGNIVNQLSQNLGAKFGVDASAAQNIALSVIPMVLSQFSQKTNDPAKNGFDINDIMGSLSGGKAQGIDFGQVLGQLNSGKGGGVDLAGLAGQLLGGGKQKGGLGDILGGFLK
jgi:hypothetical protein